MFHFGYWALIERKSENGQSKVTSVADGLRDTSYEEVQGKGDI